MRDLIFDLLKNGHKQILLNLGDVHYIDSMGLGTLVSAFTTVRKQEGELKLLNLTKQGQGPYANYKALYRLRHHERRGCGREVFQAIHCCDCMSGKFCVKCEGTQNKAWEVIHIFFTVPYKYGKRLMGTRSGLHVPTLPS